MQFCQPLSKKLFLIYFQSLNFITFRFEVRDSVEDSKSSPAKLNDLETWKRRSIFANSDRKPTLFEASPSFSLSIMSFEDEKKDKRDSQCTDPDNLISPLPRMNPNMNISTLRNRRKARDTTP